MAYFKELSWNPGIYMERLRKNTNLSQESQYLDQDLNPEPPEHEDGMLIISCNILYCFSQGVSLGGSQSTFIIIISFIY